MPGAAEAVTGAMDAGRARPAGLDMSGWDDTGQVDWLDGVEATVVRGRAGSPG